MRDGNRHRRAVGDREGRPGALQAMQQRRARRAPGDVRGDSLVLGGRERGLEVSRDLEVGRIAVCRRRWLEQAGPSAQA